MTDQDATMGGGLQGPAYQASKPQAAVNFEAVWQNAYSAEFAKAANQRMIAANPNVGPALEKLVQDYPMMSRETALGLSLSGHANYVSPAMLDLFAQEDRAAQEAAMNQGFWQKVYGGTKATSRGLMMVAEDLYNSSPVFVAPRTGINMAQGESFGSALDKSTASTAAMTTELGMLGIASNTGSGWMASDELTPADPEYFMRVKDLIASGEFEGSAEEQLLAASQQAMMEGLERYGLNPYAMAREQWQSTVMHRTIGGVDYAVPYSPGAALLLPFTTPGTRSYETFSGLVDGVSRLVFEPVDVPMDYTGELIRHSVNPLVKKGLAGYRQRAMAEVLEEGYGVEVALEPILIRHDGFTTSAKGVTSSTLDEATGTFRITVDPDITDTHYGVRMEQVVTGDDAWDLTGEFAAYVQPYADMGVTPKQVRDAIAERGGRDAEFFLTVEHELHHAEQNKKWFEIRRNEEGVAVVDYASVKPDAPEEVKQLAAQLADPEHSIGKIDELFAKGQKLEGEAAKVEADIAELSTRLDGPEQTVASRKQLRRDIGELEGKKARLADELDTARTVTDETVAKYNEAMTELNGYLESSAIKTAWNNMMDGSWIAEEAWKTYKRKQGLSRLLRPWVEPKSVNSWLKSKLGQRTLDHLARVTDIEVLRKRLKWLDERDIVKIADTTDKAVIQEIVQDAFAKPGASVRPTVGRVTDRLSKGMDGWSQTAQFVGGPVAKAMTAMGRYGSRLKTSVGNTVISMTDLGQTLDTINSVLSTIEVSRQEINRIQRMAISGHGRAATVDAIYDEIETVSKARMLERSPGLYTADELDEIWNEWRGYQIRNQHYWTSNAGKDRKWLWSNGRFRPVTDLENPNMRPEAFMEAQFSSTTRTLPPIKSFRRLYSKQRDGYEAVKKIVKNRPNGVKGWTPHGFRPTGVMDFGDWSFGIWRDMQLMRGGWAMRILPEEQLRFGAAGFSNIFKHPIDYLITLLNNELDFTIAGDNMTLGDVLRTQEALGAGTLRDLRVPPHMVRSDTFDVASRVHDPKQFWGGLSREFIMSSSDPVVSKVAQMGRDKALAFFKTTEGKEILADIANQAAQRGSLSRIVRPEELEAYLDVVELRVAQITGGDGLWLNPETGKWVDVMDRPIPKASDRAAFPNEVALHKAMVDAAGGDESVLVGMSHRSRTDLEASLNELRGYNLDELEASGRAAVITREGNEDLRGFVGQRDLDGVTIHDEMKFDEVRAIDGHLENAFASRGVEPPESWPVARGELDDPNAKTFRNRATDEFFHWFNAVPSQVMNRQPFFQQSFGVKLAEAYQYGDTELRQAIDELRGMNDSFKVTFDVGQRKLFRDLDLNEWGKPYDTIKPRTKAEPVDASQVPDSVYDEAAAAGRYDVVPQSKEEQLKQWQLDSMTRVHEVNLAMAEKYGIEYKQLKAIFNRPADLVLERSRIVQAMKPELQQQFVDEVNALRKVRAAFKKQRTLSLTELEEQAKILGWVEGQSRHSTGSGFDLSYREAVQVYVEQGMYDRVPLQNDPNSFVSSMLFKKMEEEGLFEGELMTMRGMYAQRYGRESTDYVGFPGVMFSSTNRHATAGAWATERMESLVLAESGKATIAEDIVNTFGGYVDEVENLIMEGTTEDILALAKGMDEEKAAGFIRRIEAEQTAYRVYAGEKVDKDALEETALSLGWSRDKSSGGVALGPERGMMYYYGDYTDVFDIEAFPPHLRELIDKEGDLEQLYIVNKARTPALEAMDEDFVQVWNSAREKTMFKRTITSYRELHHDEAKVLEWLDSVEDDLTTLLPEPSNNELHGGEKGKPSVRDPERVDVVNAWIQTIDEEGGLDEFEAFYNHVFDAYHPDFRAEPIPGHEQIDVNEILGLFDDSSMEVAGSFTTATPGSEGKLRKLLELELGREFTPEEWRDVMTFEQRLSYLPSEVVLHDTPIQPMGRFQREVLERMVNGFNVSFSSTEQAGNFALMLERNTKPIANLRQGVRPGEPIFEYSYRLYLPSREYGAGKIATEAEGWKMWDDWVHLDVDLRAKNKIDDAIYDMQPDGKFIQSAAEGPEMVLDFPLYMESDQFRKFVLSTKESAEHLAKATKLKFEMAIKEAGHLAPDDPLLRAIVRDATAGLRQLDEATVLIRAGSMGNRHQLLNMVPDQVQIGEEIAMYMEDPANLFAVINDVSKSLEKDLHTFEEGRVFFDMLTPNRSTFDPDSMTGWKLGSREPTEDALAGIFDFGDGPVDIGLNFDGVPQLDRNGAIERVTNVAQDGTLYDRMETGHPHHYEKSSKKAVNSLNEVMMAAKRDAIEETKDLFYDLANKANVSDAMKFIAPFGDAWYEVLSRWAKIQNPTISGGQSFRNVRRAQQVINAGRQSGFLSTNEYGQEVFNWSISPGSLVNSFIPNETNVSLQGKMPISSLMFIDPSARGVFAPGVSPVVQLSAQFLEPDSMNIPLFSDAMSWLAYGSKGEYRPAGVDDALDVPQGFFPTVLSRLVSAAFDEQSRETMGNTKLRLFESIGIAGEPGFNVMVNPADARRAWDVANTAGSWLGWLRVLDSWFLPGQPQYVPEMQYEGAEDARGMSLQEVLDQAAKLEPDTQFRIASIVRASSEYRRARELFGDAEADMYMIERYGILPSMLQSASAGMVERPVSWGGVEWVDSNPWLPNAAPLTLAWTVPPDADDTFSSRAWNNLFSEYLEIEGVENQPIRRKRSPSEILQSVQRGMGYDQLRYQNMLHDRSVAELRDQYGAGYSSDPSYRAQKNQLDRILRNNVEGVYSEFPIVRPSNQGSIVGSTQGITTRRYVDEIIDIGTPGSSRNLEFRMNVPKLASVAEQYSTWFKKMDAFSRLMSDNEASSEWWMNSDSPNAQLVRIALAKEIQAYYRGLPNDSHEKEYATKLNERLMDPLLRDWEWINSAWSFEVESYPSLKFMDTLSMEGN